MKFYKSKYGRPNSNEYLVYDKSRQYAKGKIILSHAYLKDKVVHFQPSSFSVSEEQLKWEYLECAGIEYKSTHNDMY